MTSKTNNQVMWVYIIALKLKRSLKITLYEPNRTVISAYLPSLKRGSEWDLEAK